MTTHSCSRRESAHIVLLLRQESQSWALSDALKLSLRTWAWGILILMLLFQTSLARAGEAANGFDQANRLYEQGKYREAAAAYKALLQQGRVSAALLFNLGNSLFKSGQVGRAIISYRLGEQLSPRDPDIEANLQFARDSVAGGVNPRKKVLERFLRLLTPNELTVLVTVAGWILFSLLTAGELWPALKESLRLGTKVSAACAALLGLWLTASLYVQLRGVPAVVVAKEAVVRYGPFEESQSSFTVKDGAELAILDQKDNWCQVRDSSGRIGWLRSKQAARVTPESALEGS